MNAARLVWETLVADGRDVVRTSDIGDLARRIGRGPADVATTLVRAGRLVPLFKGYYFVRRPEDLGLRPPRHNALEIFALGAEAKGIGRWYFGLETALRLNAMTHEEGGLDYVINEVLFRPAGVKVGYRRFAILRWASGMLSFGLVHDGPLRWSGPEKTVLDIAFHASNLASRGRPIAHLWREHIGSVEARKLGRLLRHYPKRVREEVAEWI